MIHAMRSKIIAVASLAAFIALAGCGESTTSAPESPSASTSPGKPKPTKPRSQNEKLRDALKRAEPAGAGQVKVRKINFGKALAIHLRTPEGGFDGPSDRDLDNSVAATLKAVYGEAKYPATKETVVVFEGGLVDTTTGKELPDANTAIYTIKGSQAKEIGGSEGDRG